MTPTKRTKNWRATPCAMNQKATRMPAVMTRTSRVLCGVTGICQPWMVLPERESITHSQSLLAQKAVIRKMTPSTMLMTLLALISKLQAIIAAPRKLEPKYPAGKVSHATPPLILVAPPSFGSSLIDSIFAPVIKPTKAWENSCMPTVRSLKP